MSKKKNNTGSWEIIEKNKKIKTEKWSWKVGGGDRVLKIKKTFLHYTTTIGLRSRIVEKLGPQYLLIITRYRLLYMSEQVHCVILTNHHQLPKHLIMDMRDSLEECTIINYLNSLSMAQVLFHTCIPKKKKLCLTMFKYELINHWWHTLMIYMYTRK